MSGIDHISGKALLYGTGKPGWAQLLPKRARVLPSPEDKAAACCMCYVCFLLCVPYQTVSMGNYVCACLLALRAAPRGGVPCSRRPAWRERLHPQTAPGKQRQPALRPTPLLSLGSPPFRRQWGLCLAFCPRYHGSRPRPRGGRPLAPNTCCAWLEKSV